MNIGLIGLDTSHCEIFSRLLNNKDDKYHVHGGTITHALPIYSADLEISKSRFEGYREIVSSNYHVKIVHDLEEMMTAVDAVMIGTVDGRNHLEWFEKVVEYGKPVFIDKPIVLSSEEMNEVIGLSKKFNVPVMSSSSLRYADSLRKALDVCQDGFQSAYLYGPLPMQTAMPGYFWYGIHLIEMTIAIFGPHVKHVEKKKHDGYEIVSLEFENGCHAVIRGDYDWHNRFGAIVHSPTDVYAIELWKDDKPYYASLLEEIVKFFETGITPVSLEETAKIVKLIESINDLN